MNNINAHAAEVRTAVFAGGCFWCMQPPFDQAEGVLHTEVGYTGGSLPHPTYAQVSRGNTGHLEAIRIFYDAQRTSYAALLDIFWHNIDPTQSDGQFADRGPQYHTAVFFADDAERKIAEASRQRIQQRFKRPVVVALRPLRNFYPAEDWHQSYYQKQPLRYQQYKRGSGRQDYIEQTWREESNEAKHR